MSYSQNDEERHILELFGDKADGKFLDIGAYDGKTFSNTRALAERGWSGVLVEPSAGPFSLLMQEYETREDINLVNAFVGYQRGMTPFWMTNDALSTASHVQWKRWYKVANFRRRCWIPTISILDLFFTFPQLLNYVDMVNIDTEGSSVELFKHFPFSLRHPRVFCVEFDDDPDLLEGIASKEGYVVRHQNMENLVLEWSK